MVARLALLAAVIASVAAAIVASTSSASSGRIACGVERWTVKTLQDRPSLKRARTTTVHYLVTRPAPPHLPNTRLPFERNIYTVTAEVVLVRSEEDGDLHLVLHSGSDQMIAESPSSSCTGRATATRRRQMTKARGLVQVCSRARVTGVAFFDFKHGQTGVAPNAIELHPVLAFRCLSGAGTTPKAAAGSGAATGKKCQAGYSPCLPVVDDLNCGDIPDSLKPIRVTGSDPYRLDVDGDGYGCE